MMAETLRVSFIENNGAVPSVKTIRSEGFVPQFLIPNSSLIGAPYDKEEY